VRRKDRGGALTIVGTVTTHDGRSIRIQRRAASNDPKLVAEEALVIEGQILREAWHGERSGARSFASAVVAYVEATPRSDSTKRRLHRMLPLIGDTPLSAIDVTTVAMLRSKLLRPNSGPATAEREIATPLRAVMRTASDLSWVSPVKIPVVHGRLIRTLFLLPDQAEQLIDAAATHLKPLLTFALCTGARVSEALDLRWADVDLVGGNAIFWQTKSGRRRNATLPDRAVASLMSLSHREGSVFLTHLAQPYANNGRTFGGQFANGFAGAIRRVGLNPAITPHTLRHTWASWYYALTKDLVGLRLEGGWSTTNQCERYVKLCPAGHEAGIRRFLANDREKGR